MRVYRRFTDEQVSQMRELYRSGSSQADIALEFSCSQTHVGKILRGSNYSAIPGALSKRERRVHTKRGTRGSFHHNAKLTEDSVLEMRGMAGRGMDAAAIAKKMGVPKGTAWRAITGRSWAHLRSAKTLSRKNPASKGENNGRVKLTELQVSYIKWHLNVGVSCSLLSKYFKVARPTINSIFRSVNWKHVKPNPNAPPITELRDPQRKITVRGERLKEKVQERVQSFQKN